MGLTSRDFNRDFKKYRYKLEYAGYKLYSTCKVRYWRLYLVDKHTNEGFFFFFYSIEEAYEVAANWIRIQADKLEGYRNG